MGNQTLLSRMPMSRPRQEVPIDVAEDILVRSQPKDLVRCKAVCKAWLDLISSPRFINKHLLHQSTTRKKIIAVTNIRHQLVSMSLDTHEEPSQLYLPHPPRNGPPAIDGSCNGILCLISEPDRKRILLWNPSTRVHLRAPFVPDQEDSFVFALGFGYDATSQDYKVVVISHKTHDRSYDYRRREYIVEVWSTKSTHGFRKVNSPASSEILKVVPEEYIIFQFPLYSIYHHPGIFLRGKLYWLLHQACLGYVAVLICFDMGDETVCANEILPHAIASQVENNSIVPFDFMGSLAMPIWPDENDNLFHIWVLDDDDKTWTHKLTIGPFQSGWACPAGVCIDGKFLMRVEKKYFLYDSRTDEEEELVGAESPCWDNYGFGHPCWSFVESLVSLQVGF